MLTTSLALVAALCAPGDSSVFAAPLRLTAGGVPMGNDQLYPSPILYDVDGNGALEMVVGDLLGNLMVSERLPGDDTTAWSEPEPLEGADGESLEFNNW